MDDAERTIGGLNLYADRPRAFSTGPGWTAAAFARQAALLLRFLRGAHIDRAVHARQLEMAVGLQRSLLPTLPRLAGISSAARYLAGGPDAQVGGDWYDLFALPDTADGNRVAGLRFADARTHALLSPRCSSSGSSRTASPTGSYAPWSPSCSARISATSRRGR